MVDDTLGISVCGVGSKNMNSFLNKRTSLMNLQFGCDKCEKVHVGKKKNTDICPKLTIDSWKEQVEEEDGRGKVKKDIFAGKEIMNDVSDKKYLGDIVAKDGSNTPS